MLFLSFAADVHSVQLQPTSRQIVRLCGLAKRPTFHRSLPNFQWHMHWPALPGKFRTGPFPASRKHLWQDRPAVFEGDELFGLGVSVPVLPFDDGRLKPRHYLPDQVA